MKKILSVLIVAMIMVGVLGISTSNAYAGYVGYVHGDYVQVVSRPDRSGYYTLEVVLADPVNGYLNVRQYPSTDAPIIGRLYHGDRITGNVWLTTDPVPSGWWPVTYYY